MCLIAMHKDFTCILLYLAGGSQQNEIALFMCARAVITFDGDDVKDNGGDDDDDYYYQIQFNPAKLV